jgi:hypothetical protein
VFIEGTLVPSSLLTCRHTKFYTDKKEKKIFLIYQEIKRDRVQSHMTNFLLIYGEKFAHFLIYRVAAINPEF